jgi:hypothetical protein
VPTEEKNVIATKTPIVIFVEKSDTPPPVELMIQQGYRHSTATTSIFVFFVKFGDIFFVAGHFVADHK